MKKWSPTSEDCNQIGNVWALLNTKIRQRKIATKEALIPTLNEEYQSLTAEYDEKISQKLYNFMHGNI